MDIYKQRISALRAAMAGLSQKDFANQHGLDASYLSQLLNGHRKLGEKAAATLEEKINLHPGSLVNPDLLSGSDTAEIIVPAAAPVDSRTVMQSLGFITIPHLDVAASMGSGNVPPDSQIEVIKDITVHLDWLKTQGLAFSRIENLAIITGDGDSMDGTFRDGDSLLVDRGITEIRTDAIYVFTLDGDLYIKRLQRMTGGALRMISDNPLYPAIIIEGADLTKVHIQARVLLVWNAKKL
ncbi:LexA family transcriptional regulator [Pseudomonas fragariae (ex Marin et al. 2024)]|uniref:LexA family transcriptional regulator n=2 Tax=Pseudomonas fragariae (ex Marin et al. 2024) TaxID=3080056 RepID=A0ABT3LPA3_9PSED|nr:MULTISPECIES: LexA family transcriptional regulator [unclassified Pseudomonas]MCW6058262.1 LexA family transcriptional regulator [Pseudomonas fragi]MDV0428357.1 LexA family transcriptional regulator [Pseudomonas sp. 17]MDX9574001.1 LexA family transcriptional regulator [Pseudomonas sp. 21(2023)]MDX9586823.1 LexA family transcriptional regulator [Pseudomonas sp. 19(2023)]MDY6478693.1 LexA family transcriptional regulator [Pseudomonas sp. 18]